MSLDVYLTELQSEFQPVDVFTSTLTHNLVPMAAEAGLYKVLWRPDELGIIKASQLIEPLRAGLKLLRSDPERFKALNPSNGWGNYENLVEFVAQYLEACKKNRDADVYANR